MKINKNLIVIFFITMLLSLVTIPKLYKMFQIIGKIKSNHITNTTITKKWRSVNGGTSVTYYITWTKNLTDIKQNERDNLDKKTWNTLEVGDPIQVFTFRNDDSAYTPYSIFVEKGNFIFDFVLLTIEFILLLFFIYEYFRTRER